MILRLRTRFVASVALAGTLIAAPGIADANSIQLTTAGAVKAAFLLTFAKFTEWPALTSGAPIVFCIVGDDEIAAAVAGTLRGQNIGGHPLEVRRGPESAAWQNCHVLFIAGAERRRSTVGLAAIKSLPVLTVSDGQGFAQQDGIIELYVERERLRFAINLRAAQGLKISSRLLALAKIVR